jgi:hypothetical protein
VCSSDLISEQQSSEWVREQYQRANKHLAEQGVLFESVVTEESRYLAPYVAVWKIKSTEGKYYWVISGDVPADAIPYEAEKNAQETLRAFSMRWQLQAENILQSNTNDQLRQDFAKLLITKAEMVYDLFANENNWL